MSVSDVAPKVSDGSPRGGAVPHSQEQPERQDQTPNQRETAHRSTRTSAHRSGSRPRRLLDQPDDFGFMTASDWLDFHCELYDVVAGLEPRIATAVRTIDPGVVRLANGQSIGLLELAGQCHRRPRDDWRGLIERHLRIMTTHLGGVASEISMFDLRVRLVTDQPTDRGALDQLGARPFAEGIVAILSVDVDGTPRTVPRREIAEQGWDLEETWLSAWAQTETLEEPDELQIVDVAGAEIIHLFGEHPYTASLVRWLQTYVGPLGEHGAVVSLPLDHTILIHSIEDERAKQAIAAMVPITRHLSGQPNAALSPHLYWWRGGELTWIPTVFGEGVNECYLPPGLDGLITSF